MKNNIFKSVFMLFFKKKTAADHNRQEVVLLEDITTTGHRSFTETGEFIKAGEFERIWVVENDHNSIGRTTGRPTDILTDDEYLDYHIWEDMNYDALIKKHKEKSIVLNGKNPNIIFHGGCLGCLSQRLYGIERCKGCMYFRWRGNTNLFIEGEESAKMSAEEFKRFISGKK